MLGRLFSRRCSASASLFVRCSRRLVTNAGSADHYLGRLACLAVLGAAGLATAESAESQGPPPGAEQGWHMLSLEQRRHVFFKYEKRIREMSPQEKVFDYFASQYDSAGQSYMLPGDMLRAVVPVYPPLGSNYVRSGSLAGEPNPEAPVEESEFFKEFDIDGDGCISFDEYLLFTTLLSIPSEDLQVAFKILDTDGSGTVDVKEFSKLLNTLHARGARPKASNRNVVHRDEKERLGLMLRFFGKDGTNQLTLDGFCSFIAALREELIRLEFKYYDFQNKGFITGRDFAYSIVGCASHKYIDEYLNKVQEMPAELAGAKISLEQLKAFHQVWRHLRLLSVALEFIQNTSGVVTAQDFEWVAEQVLHTKLSKEQVSVVFYLFPSKDGRGLNAHYMHKVLCRHHATGLNIVYDYEQRQSPRSYFDCIKECYQR